MDHTGTRILTADRATIWRHLTTPASLAFCIPGCESVSGSLESGFDMVVRQKVGPFHLHFAGTIDLSEVAPGERVTLTGRGKGGVAGLAQGSARIRLSDHPEGTEIAWDLGALLEGRVARLGRKPIQAAVAKMTAHFLNRLDALIRGTDPAA